MRSLLTLMTVLIAHPALAERVGRCDFERDRLTLRAPGAPTLELVNGDGRLLGHEAQGGLDYVVHGPLDVITPRGAAVQLPRGLSVTVDCEHGALTAGFQADALPAIDGASGGASADAMAAMEEEGLEANLGGVAFTVGWAPGAAMDDVLGPHDDDTWYLFMDARIEGIQATVGGMVVDPGLSSQISWWVDPTDPAIYAGVRGGLIDMASMGYVTGAGVGFSANGNLQWTPAVQLRGPDGHFDPNLHGHVAVETEVNIQPIPRTDVSIGIDADFMFDLGARPGTAEMTRVARDFKSRRVELDDHRDVRFGANARSITLNFAVFSMELASGSFFADRDGVYLTAEPNIHLGAGFMGVSARPDSDDRLEKLRRLLEVVEIRPSELYLYVDRRTREWGLGMVADVEIPGCMFHDAEVRISDDGIDVQGEECDFRAWARTQLDFICAGIDNDVNRCEDAAERDACDFECGYEAQACYDRCRANGTGKTACKIYCGLRNAGCTLVEGATAVCDAALTACAAIDDFCEGDDATEPPIDTDPVIPVEPVEPNPPNDPPADPTPTCDPRGVSGYTLINRGNTGCGRWGRNGDTLTARGNLHTPGQRPKAGSLLIKNFSAPAQLRDGRIEVHIQGDDDDVAGVVFGAQAGGLLHYLAVLDEQYGKVQVWRKDALGFTKLGENHHAVNFSRGHGLRVERAGSIIRVKVDGQLRLTVSDGRMRWGRYGVYSYANDHMRFTGLKFVAGCGSNEFSSYEMRNLGQHGCGGWDRDTQNRMVAVGNEHTSGQRPKYGSLLLREGVTRAQGDISARIQGNDDDAAGLVIDYATANLYNFAVLDEERGKLQIWSRLPAVGFIKMGEANFDVHFSRGHQVRLKRVGGRLELWVDGARRLNRPVPGAGGRMGAYAYAMSHIGFANLTIH